MDTQINPLEIIENVWSNYCYGFKEKYKDDKPFFKQFSLDCINVWQKDASNKLFLQKKIQEKIKNFEKEYAEDVKEILVFEFKRLLKEVR